MDILEKAQALQILETPIQKSEGSRGGNVISHTKSGKAIYAHIGASEHNSTNHLLRNTQTGEIHKRTEREVKELTGKSPNELPKDSSKTQSIISNYKGKPQQAHYLGKDTEGNHVTRTGEGKEAYHSHYSEGEMNEVYGKNWNK